jgi:hypothetical protein
LMVSMPAISKAWSLPMKIEPSQMGHMYETNLD